MNASMIHTIRDYVVGPVPKRKRLPKSIRRLIEESRPKVLKGEVSERRTVRTLLGLQDQGYIPIGVVSREKTLSKLDRDGVDVVLGTDCGEVHIQVKSSADAAKKFLRQNKNRNIVVVVAGPQIETNSLKADLISQISEAYKKLNSA